MPADFYIDVQLGVVFSKAKGEFSRADAAGHMEQLLGHPDFHPDLKQLLDFREITKLALSSDEVRDLATRTIFSTHAQRAFVVSSDSQFGLSRIFSTHRELQGETGIKIFREMKEALGWLSLPTEPDAKMFKQLNSLANEASL